MGRAATIPQCLDRIRRSVTLAAVIVVVTALMPIPLAAQEVPELQITSTNYILVDAKTGEILAQRGAHERRAPASITKIFTAIETIETAPGNVEITTAEADLVSEFASSVGFSPGEVFSVEELLYGMMLPSGNDAARALARGLGAEEGDSEEEALNRFVAKINQRVQDMGLTDTHLVNPDGWGVPDHYSSPYDLAAFMMYALQYPRFVQAFSTLDYETADGAYEFHNNNRMLRTYDGIVGGKTGYDDDAGWCLINVAQRDGNTVIAVTMNGVAPDDWYDDNQVLLDYGLEQLAQRKADGTGVTGEIVRFRDPDAAVILAMGSAGSAIGPPQVAKVAAAAPPVDLVPAVVEAPDGIPLSPQSGASSAGLVAAAAVAAALILLQGLTTWRLRSPRRSVAASNDAARLGPQPSVTDPVLQPPAAGD